MQTEINSEKICLQDDSSIIDDFKEKYDYLKFTDNGFELDKDLLKKFQSIASKLNLSDESCSMLLDIALEMSKKQRAIYEKDEKLKLDENVKKYDDMFKNDPELPKLNSLKVKEYMNVANNAYSSLCSNSLKELLKKTGLNFHPELIKLFHTIGELMNEDSLTYSGKPIQQELTPAQILYGPRD